MKLGKQTIVFTNKPKVIGNYSVAGQKEGFGNFKEFFEDVDIHKDNPTLLYYAENGRTDL